MTCDVNLVGLKRVVNMKLHFFQWMPQNGSANPIPLVFLHGMGGTGQIWRPVAAKLEDEFRCIAFDQRGHGLSQAVPGEEAEFHALDYGRDVLAALSDLGIHRFVLIGHSMGVRTALAVATLAREKVAGLIAVDIGITSAWGGGIGLPLAEFIEQLPRSFPDRSQLRDYLFRECPDPAIAQYLSAVAKKISESPEEWAFPFDHRALVETIHQANSAPIEEWVRTVAQAHIPLSFLRGVNSKVWLKEDFEKQQAEFAPLGVHFEEWENCGHGLPFEQRTKFIDYVRAFVLNLT